MMLIHKWKSVMICRVVLSVIGIICAGLLASESYLPAHPIPRTQARQVAFDRAAGLARTINIGRWFGRDVPATYSHYANYIQPSEARRIHGWGFNAVRLPINEPFLFVKTAQDSALDPVKLQLLDNAVKTLNDAGLAVIVDFHSKKRVQHEKSLPYRDRMVRFWTLLASHLANKTKPDLVYLELLNEPRFMRDTEGWNRFQGRLFAAVRKVAPKHTIIATSTKYSDPQTFLYLRPIKDDNVIYTLHTYDPIAFSHQGAAFLNPQLRKISGLPWPAPGECRAIANMYQSEIAAVDYINDYCSSGWNDEKFAKYIDPALKWSKRYDVPLFVGEFGVRSVAAPESDRMRWISMARAYFNRNGLSWALWSFDDCYGLSLKVQGACPAGADGQVDLAAGWQRACKTLTALNMAPADCRRSRPKDIVPD
jgi:endoglucanase